MDETVISLTTRIQRLYFAHLFLHGVSSPGLRYYDMYKLWG